MNSTPDDPQPGFLIALVRVLGRSRLGQFSAAVLVAFVSSGLAYLIWQYRTLAALYLTYYVLFYGARKAWKILPIPVAARRAWVRRKDLYGWVAIVCCVLVAPLLPGTTWPGWHAVIFCLLGVVLASVTPVLAWLDTLDRRKKAATPE